MVEDVVGTGKADKIFDDPSNENRLDGGGGDDLIEGGMYDNVYGGTGNDTLIGNTWFITLNGQGGKDKILTFDRNHADGGNGIDRCTLGLGSTAASCERLVQRCPGSGAPLPTPVTSLTTATGDFDGNGVDGTLQAYHYAGSWYARIVTDGGYGAIGMLPTGGAEAARALGGRDLNQDGMDEALLVTGAGAYTELVSIYALAQPIAAPPGMHCAVRPAQFAGGAADATFPVGASVGNQSGLKCLTTGVREYQQSTGDGTNYDHMRTVWTYLPDSGQSNGGFLYWSGTSNQVLVRPFDDAVIDAVGDLYCGSLSL